MDPITLLLIAAGGWLLLKKKKPASSGGSGPRFRIYEGDQGTWWYAGYIGGQIKVTDGPFASPEAATTAGQNWVAAQHQTSGAAPRSA